jgi:acyl-CoA synthetase (AMP-forming)/AMP-acid ligase II
MRVRHETGMLGYARHADGEMFLDAGEHWTTGDLVRRHDGDRIEVLGRTDFAVNRDGLLVHISDIESCLSRVPGVAQAVVAIVGTTRRGVGLHARCTLEDGASPDPETILAACRAGLPARAVPDTLAIVDDLPLLPSGKFDRRAINAAVLAQTQGDA